ncbi:MAG: hypothetical protein LBE95_03790 [Holosporaceae bacterium]|jgi:hypothetical protein|nr:hypothetical protein [Holosporaceae bacterium]
MTDNDFIVNDYGEGIGAITRRADSVLLHLNNLQRVNFLDYQWRTFFPDMSYREITDYALEAIDVLTETAIGSFHSASMKETNDTPEINFNLKKQNMPFNDEEAMIEISQKQIELFKMVNEDNNILERAISLMDMKINSAYKVAGEVHNEIFFKGNSKIDGILQNPFIVDITDQVTPTTDYIAWFAQAAMVAGLQTNDKISTPNIYISTDMAAKLNSYADGTDRSLLNKIESIQISRQGKVSKLNIRVLSYLKDTPNDVLFLSDDGFNFFYAYKPLRFHPFRNFGIKSFSSLCEFAYTEPLVFKKYAFVKATYNAS